MTSANANLVFYRRSRRSVEILLESARNAVLVATTTTAAAAAAADPIVLDRSRTRREVENRYGTIGQFSQRRFFRPVARGYSRSRTLGRCHRVMAFTRSSNRADNSRYAFYNTFFTIKISIAVNRSSDEWIYRFSFGTRVHDSESSYRFLRHFLLLYILIPSEKARKRKMIYNKYHLQIFYFYFQLFLKNPFNLQSFYSHSRRCA